MFVRVMKDPSFTSFATQAIRVYMSCMRLSVCPYCVYFGISWSC